AWGQFRKKKGQLASGSPTGPSVIGIDAALGLSPNRALSSGRRRLLVLAIAGIGRHVTECPSGKNDGEPFRSHDLYRGRGTVLSPRHSARCQPPSVRRMRPACSRVSSTSP